MKLKFTAGVLCTLIFSAMGCTQLERKNPTDPSASNYIGIHYTGDTGEFVALSDIEAKESGGQAYIYGTDNTQQIVVKYELSGNYAAYWAAQDLPTGICSDSASNLYVIDEANYVEIYNPNGTLTGQFHFAPGSGGGKAACDGAYLYAATASPPKVYKYALSAVATPNPTPDASWGAAGTCDGCYSVISAIESDAAGNIIVADSALRRITITNASGSYVNKINTDYDISGIAVKDSKIYVPGTGGITVYDYNGAIVKKFADYGEGKGKVTAAGPIALHDTQVLVGTPRTIKVFKP